MLPLLLLLPACEFVMLQVSIKLELRVCDDDLVSLSLAAVDGKYDSRTVRTVSLSLYPAPLVTRAEWLHHSALMLSSFSGHTTRNRSSQ